jgi:MFS family permease
MLCYRYISISYLAGRHFKLVYVLELSFLILGLAYLAIAIPPFFITPISGWMSDTFTPKLPALIGMILATVFLNLLRVPTGTGETNAPQAVLICTLLTLLSIFPAIHVLILDVALSFVTTPSISEISHISNERGNGRHAQAYALFNMAFSGGFLIGPLGGGFITKAKGWNTMVTGLGVLAIISVPPIIIWTGGPINQKRQKSADIQSEQI